MVRFGGFLGVVALIFWLYCLFDIISAPRTEVRNLPRALWIIVVVLLTVPGGILWLVAGRPRAGVGGRSDVSWLSTPTAGLPEHERPGRHHSRPVGPDDDPEFLRQLDHRLRDDNDDDSTP